ncbi:hypothetical protein SAMN04488128_106236 [Chitinophaga eiseniae]|uniref:Uncharacterized protein n=1 Tax=Chitinophaga eiseniae TaxID=634771 RepID=A0A1T4TT76_9BACT|nr:hypothetical protein SAMN04488128_106236 [Chitinophaga eiseniae]
MAWKVTYYGICVSEGSGKLLSRMVQGHGEAAESKRKDMGSFRGGRGDVKKKPPRFQSRDFC